MEFNTYTVKRKSQTDWISLHFIGDIHIGQGNHNRERLLERINVIKKDPLAIWMGMGDYGDHIYYTDPRFDLNSMDGSITIGDLRDGILKQVRKFCDDIKPIKNKCIGIGSGNHEETIAKKCHVDPTREAAFRLNVSYAGYCSLTRIHLSTSGARQSVVLFAHHGYGAGRKHGAQINKIEDAMRIAPSADIYAMGHVHGKVASTLDVIDITQKGKMLTRQKAFVITGSYSDTYRQGVLSYAERNMFTQAGLGSPAIQFRFRNLGRDGKKYSALEMKIAV